MDQSQAAREVASSIVAKGNYRKLSVRQLKNLGYKLTDNQIPLGSKPYKFGILEVKNESAKDVNKEVTFSLLYSVDDKMGIILPNPYNYYVLKPLACYDTLR